MSKIKNIHAREILDSRGNPTIEVEIITTNNKIGRAAIPSGASTGKHEAIELRDKDMNRFLGKGVLNAIHNVNNLIFKSIKDINITDQQKIDQILIDLDGTENKSNLGANAILGVSIASAKAAANELNKPLYKYLGNELSMDSFTSTFTLPMPFINVINGGCHADNSLDIQEFMIVPIGASSFHQAIQMGSEIFHNLAKILKSNNLSTNVGDEGGYAPNLDSDDQAVELILQAIEKSGYKVSQDVSVAIDAASTEFYDPETQTYNLKNSKGTLDYTEMVEFWKNWINKYPIISLEDPMAEDDWVGWQELTKQIGSKTQIVGDDLFVTNPNRLQKGIDIKAANSILIKMNQIGTLSETINTTNIAVKNNFKTIISHRSGETEDTTIADLSVALNAGQIKTGSLSRSDRTAKYNQLLRIEEDLGSSAFFHKLKEV